MGRITLINFISKVREMLLYRKVLHKFLKLPKMKKSQPEQMVMTKNLPVIMIL